MPIAVVATIVGLLLPLTLPLLPANFGSFGYLLSVALVVAGQKISVRLIRCSVLLVAGLTWSIAVGSDYLEHKFPPIFDYCDVRVQGRIDDLPQTSEDRLRFNFHVSSTKSVECTPDRLQAVPWLPDKNHRLRLSAYRGYPLLQAGDWLDLQVRLRAPRTNFNPGGFDYEAWLALREVGAIGYVRDFIEIRSSRAGVDYWRDRMGRWLAKLSGLEHTGYIRALLLADQRGLTPADWELLNKTGTTHLLVVSGLHISLIAAIGALLGFAFGWLSGVTANRSAILFACFFALGYALLTGLGIAAQRASIFVMIFAGFNITHRWLPLNHRYFYSMLIILWLTPLAPLSAGFWLSFGAVLALLIMVKSTARMHWLYRLPLIQIALSLLLAPLLIWVRGDTSLAAPIANLVAVPILSFLILPSLLLASLIDPFLLLLGFEVPLLFHLSDKLLSILLVWLNWLARLDLQWWQSSHLMWLGFIAGLVALLPLAWALRGLAALLWVPTLLFTPQIDQYDFRIVVLDVGQGLSIFIQAQHEAVIYDTGPSYPGGFDAGRDVLNPALNYFGVKEVSHIVVSHTDLDHIGGLHSVKKRWPKAKLIASQKLTRKEATIDCLNGHHWQLGKISFETFVALPEATNDNDLSCLLLLSSGSFKALFPGDISDRAEQALSDQKAIANIQLLVAAHHGSATSSGLNFMEQSRPERVIYSAGWRNRFGHPAKRACDNAQKVKALLFNTAFQGALEFLIKQGDIVTTRVWRCESRRWWRSLDRTVCSPAIGLANGCDY